MNNKFNNFEQLEKSYNNLEKEFTKKCQLVAQLTKQLECGTSDVSPPQTEEEFFTAFPDAQKFLSQLKEKFSDPAYDGYADRYVRAYVDFLLKQIVSAEQLAADPHFLEQHIFNNPQIADRFLQILFATGKVACPPTICGNSGNMTLSQPTRPKTIAEASALAQKYFN